MTTVTWKRLYGWRTLILAWAVEQASVWTLDEDTDVDQEWTGQSISPTVSDIPDLHVKGNKTIS